MLNIDNISVAYDSQTILRGLSFDVPEGRLLALLGPNGAGKTTLLKALNATVPIEAGKITLDGSSLHAISRRDIAKRIAVVAQENETRFPVTALEFVLSGRFIHGGTFGWESETDIAAAMDALKECDLSGFEFRLMNNLSGGERQRVVLARALATGANILLLDEPTANLDLAHQAMMFKLVRRRSDDMGAAAVVITHDLNTASEFADEILLLKAGSIVAQGPPADVLTGENIRKVFDVETLLDTNPATGNVRVTNVF